VIHFLPITKCRDCGLEVHGEVRRGSPGTRPGKDWYR
jgi:hypothetical protein